MIRNVVEHDFVACFEITRRAWPAFKERESIYHLFCKHFSDTSFVEDIDGNIVGFLLAFLSQTQPGVLYVHLVVVDPMAQGRGIASTLYARIFEQARALSCTCVSCIVNPDNEASLRLHRRLGFLIDASGEIVLDHGVVAGRDYNGPGTHMVRFFKEM